MIRFGLESQLVEARTRGRAGQRELVHQVRKMRTSLVEERRGSEDGFVGNLKISFLRILHDFLNSCPSSTTLFLSNSTLLHCV